MVSPHGACGTLEVLLSTATTNSTATRFRLFDRLSCPRVLPPARKRESGLTSGYKCCTVDSRWVRDFHGCHFLGWRLTFFIWSYSVPSRDLKHVKKATISEASPEGQTCLIDADAWRPIFREKHDENSLILRTSMKWREGRQSRRHSVKVEAGCLFDKPSGPLKILVFQKNLGYIQVYRDISVGIFSPSNARANRTCLAGVTQSHCNLQ